MQRRGRERRRFVRIAEDLLVGVTVSGDEAPRDSRTLNFSAGGVLLLLEEPLEPGTDAQVVLRLDGPEHAGVTRDRGLLEFTARVLRVRTLADRAHEVAAEFVGGSASDQRALQDLIAERLDTLPPAPLSA